MKKITGLFLVLGFVLAFPVLKLHAQSFEGTVTWTMTFPIGGDDDPHPMIINIKGQKTETEMEMGAMGSMKSYSDGKKSYGLSIMGGMKNGFVMDMPSDSATNAMSQKQLGDVDLKPTGKKETIAGHPAEEYVLTGVNMKGMIFDMSIWAAADFPKSFQEILYNSMKNSPGQDSKQTKAMKQFADKGLVPVRMVMKKDGEVAVTTEFVKYEQKSLDDALFIPPTDVTFKPIPKMGGGTN